MWHVWETGNVETWFTWGDPREGNDLEYQGVDGRIILKRRGMVRQGLD